MKATKYQEIRWAIHLTAMDDFLFGKTYDTKQDCYEDCANKIEVPVRVRVTIEPIEQEAGGD